MTRLAIAFVGMGSIGKRHIVNLHQVLTARGINYTCDVYTRRPRAVGTADHERYITRYIDVNLALEATYDIAFIVNPTHLHYSTIQRFASHAVHMFIEKPVFDRTDCDYNALALGAGVYYVAAPLRYHALIQHIKHHIVTTLPIYSVRAICSSYLPDWRPGVDYRTVYSAKKAEGGGVSIDLIHELDYIRYWFGPPQSIKNYHGTLSHLEIDSDDVSIYMARYADKLVEIHLDYIGRVARRQVELFTDEDVIIADLLSGELRYLKSGRTETYEASPNQKYVAEIEAFIGMTLGELDNHNDINFAIETLKIAKEE